MNALASPELEVADLTFLEEQGAATQHILVVDDNPVDRRMTGGMVDKVLAAAQATQQEQQVLDCLTTLESSFELENDAALVPAMVSYLQDALTRLRLWDHTARIRVGIALEEAITNAIYHGNLELSSELRQDGTTNFHKVAEERCRLSPYGDRRVFIHARLSRAGAEYVIRDEGTGFDPTTLPDPTDPANLGRIGGRGLLLIRTFMDEVRFNSLGNEITLIKRRDPSKTQSCAS